MPIRFLVRRLSSKASDVLTRYSLPDAFSCPISRDVLKIEGVDAGRFLQGMLTSDVYALLNDDRRQGQFSSVLTAQGRTMFDCFVYKLAGHDPFPKEIEDGSASSIPLLIEADHDVGLRIQLFLASYKLRSKVVMSNVTDKCDVWIHWNQQQQPSKDAIVSMKDERSDWSITRSIRPKSGVPHSNHPYRLMRHAFGVAEGMEEVRIREALPFDSNIDLMGGIAFRKGCYLGQELVARTHHRGVVRRRMLPFRMYGPLNELMDYTALESARLGWHYARLKPSPYADQWMTQDLHPVERGPDKLRPISDRSFGKCVTLEPDHNIGWATVRLEEFESSPLFVLLRSDCMILCEAIAPSFMQAALAEQ